MHRAQACVRSGPADPRQGLGIDGEAVASAALRARGYAILESRFRTPLGEIDLIARDEDTLVFVEVKTRRDDAFGGGAAAVTWRKQRTLTRVAEAFLARTRLGPVPCRFDVVVVHWPATGDPTTEVFRNAFDAAR
jgi:putative endonuclease